MLFKMFFYGYYLSGVALSETFLLYMRTNTTAAASTIVTIANPSDEHLLLPHSQPTTHCLKYLLLGSTIQSSSSFVFYRRN